jgi:hypothetical protein
MQNWKTSILKGSDYHEYNGIVGLEDKLGGHPRGSFSGKTSIILGASSRTDSFGIESTTVKWNIPFPIKSIMDFDKGHLIIACKRSFGGLHSKDYDGRVNVEINGKNIDSFGLRIITEGHSDYFHRIQIPNEIPLLKPFNNCQTIYSWDLWNDRLKFKPFQELEITIGNTVRWDIDYIGIVYTTVESEPEVFISYNHNDKDNARLIANDLNDVGIKSWIDEGQLGIGDSIIEKISDGLDNVKYLVALISKSSIQSNWVKKELSIAMTKEINSRKLQVLPLVLDGTNVPTLLSDKYYGDISSSEKYNSVLNQIIMKIKSA